MQNVTLEYMKEWNKYNAMISKGKTIEYLEIFLNDNVIDNIPFYQRWVEDPSSDEVYGNHSHVKKNNNLIYIGSQFSDTSDDSSFFILTKDEFVSLLDQWQRVTLINPKKIMITEENGVITIKPA